MGGRIERDSPPARRPRALLRRRRRGGRRLYGPNLDRLEIVQTLTGYVPDDVAMRPWCRSHGARSTSAIAGGHAPSSAGSHRKRSRSEPDSCRSPTTRGSLATSPGTNTIESMARSGSGSSSRAGRPSAPRAARASRTSTGRPSGRSERTWPTGRTRRSRRFTWLCSRRTRERGRHRDQPAGLRGCGDANSARALSGRVLRCREAGRALSAVGEGLLELRRSRRRTPRHASTGGDVDSHLRGRRGIRPLLAQRSSRSSTRSSASGRSGDRRAEHAIHSCTRSPFASFARAARTRSERRPMLSARAPPPRSTLRWRSRLRDDSGATTRSTQRCSPVQRLWLLRDLFRLSLARRLRAEHRLAYSFDAARSVLRLAGRDGLTPAAARLAVARSSGRSTSRTTVQ